MRKSETLVARIIILIALLFLLNGCATYQRIFGGKDNTEPPAPLVEFTSSANIVSVWSARAGSGTAGNYLKLLPAVSENLVVVADASGSHSFSSYQPSPDQE